MRRTLLRLPRALPRLASICLCRKTEVCPMRSIQSTTLLFVLFLFGLTPGILAQGTYIQIDNPNGVNGTFVQGTDTAGDLVGSYIDVSFNTHGFLFSNGVYTTIDYPGAT